MKIKTSELISSALDWAVEEALGGEHPYRPRSYSTDWAFGGPIIDREKICPWFTTGDGFWKAAPLAYMDGMAGGVCTGPTPLIAAMRCYVASKLGDEVEIPEDVP